MSYSLNAKGEASDDPRPAATCVHILQCGRPLCGFTEKLPIDWPSGHYWLGPANDHDYNGRPMCEACLLAKHGYRERFRLSVLRVFQHQDSGLCFVRFPGMVLAWTPKAWWRMRLVRLSRWEFTP